MSLWRKLWDNYSSSGGESIVTGNTIIGSGISGDPYDVNPNLNLDSIIFNKDYTPTGSEEIGSVFWDEASETFTFILKNDVKGQLFEELYVSGQNDTGSTLANGKVATYAGSIGNSGNIRVSATTASASELPQYTLGVFTQDIANGGSGKITTYGKVRGIQTNGVNYGETWAAGDVLYKSGTVAGGMTNVRPIAPIPAIVIGTVISAHATNGTIIVRPTFPATIKNASDVYINNIQNNQVLVWNSTTNRFENKTLDVYTKSETENIAIAMAMIFN